MELVFTFIGVMVVGVATVGLVVAIGTTLKNLSIFGGD